MKHRKKILNFALALAGTFFLQFAQAESSPSISPLTHKQSKKQKIMKFKLTPLDYPSDALEPYIDAETVALHHGKHQATYVDKLNAALETQTDFAFADSLTEILSNLDKLPQSIALAVRNNGGGVWNHEFYWKGLSPKKTQPTEALAVAIDKDFGNVDKLKEDMTNAAIGQFGSGWAWLCVDKNGALKIRTTQNQDSPIMFDEKDGQRLVPILAIDVWEHAYYLKYRNLRKAYLDAFWNVVNWQKVGERYKVAIATKKPLL